MKPFCNKLSLSNIIPGGGTTTLGGGTTTLGGGTAISGSGMAFRLNLIIAPY